MFRIYSFVNYFVLIFVFKIFILCPLFASQEEWSEKEKIAAHHFIFPHPSLMRGQIESWRDSLPPFLINPDSCVENPVIVLQLPGKKLFAHAAFSEVASKLFEVVVERNQGAADQTHYRIAIQTKQEKLQLWPHIWAFRHSLSSQEANPDDKEALCKIVYCSAGDQRASESVSWSGKLDSADQPEDFAAQLTLMNYAIHNVSKGRGSQDLTSLWTLAVDAEGNAAVTLHVLMQEELVLKLARQLQLHEVECGNAHLKHHKINQLDFTYSGLRDIDVLQFMSAYDGTCCKILKLFSPATLCLNEEIAVFSDETDEKSRLLNPPLCPSHFKKDTWFFDDLNKVVWSQGRHADFELPIHGFGDDLMISFPEAYGFMRGEHLLRPVHVSLLMEDGRSQYIGTLRVKNTAHQSYLPEYLECRGVKIPGHLWLGASSLKLRFETPGVRQSKMVLEENALMNTKKTQLHRGFSFSKLKISSPEAAMANCQIDLGKTYFPTLNGGDYHLLGPGFSMPEGTHVWTQGPSDGSSYRASIFLGMSMLPSHEERNVMLRLGAYAVKGQRQIFEVQLNGKAVEEIPGVRLEVDDSVEVNPLAVNWEHWPLESFHLLKVIFTPNSIPNYNGLVEINFTIYRPLSPKKVGFSEDSRFLGLNIESLKVN